jgi:hypothetical protein
VSGLKDLTITTTELIDSLASNAKDTKYKKQEQFKKQHCPATPRLEGILDNLANRINKLC